MVSGYVRSFSLCRGGEQVVEEISGRLLGLLSQLLNEGFDLGNCHERAVDFFKIGF